MPKVDWLFRRGTNSSSNVSRYVYGNGRLPPRSIRLLNLLPGRRDEPIECKLVTTALDGAPQYEALSYCWGESDLSQAVTCNNQPFHIRRNLYNALQNLRQTDKARALWVDALCINQQDYTERNAQLGVMAQVFSRTEKVNAYIGEESPSFDTVKNKIVPVAQSRSSINRFNSVFGDNARLVWQHIRIFFERPYFRRAWVIQELVNATNIKIVCGQQEMDWESLMEVAHWGRQAFEGLDTELVCQHIRFLERLRRGLKNGTHPSLLHLLLNSRRCDASDLRDKIYSLYPLVHDQLALPQPNYDMPVAEVFKQTAVHLIRETGNLDIFSCCSPGPTSDSLSLPSWVPDWHSQDGIAPFAIMTGFDAEPLIFDISDDMRTIFLQGYIFDTIAAVSKPLVPLALRLETGEDILSHILQEQGSKAVLEPSGEVIDLDHSFARQFTDEKMLHRRYPKTAPPAESGAGPWIFVRLSRLTTLFGRLLFRGFSGQLGIGSVHAKPGDKVVVFKGASVPYIVRQTVDGKYTLVGEALVPQYLSASGIEKRGNTISMALV